MNVLRLLVLLGVVWASTPSARADEETVRADDYEVTVSTTRAAVVDQPAEITVVVAARGPYGIDHASPISLQIAAPRDVEVPAEALQQGDAVLSRKRAAFRAVV